MVVKLAIELVLHTFSEARNEYYLTRHPDLISVGNFTSIDYTQLAQSSWQDSVYAPIIILSCIENKPAKAARYVDDIRKHLRWLEKQPNDIQLRHPIRYTDCSAVAFYYFVSGQFDDLIDFLNWATPQWNYLVAKMFFEYCNVAYEARKPIPVKDNLIQLIKRENIPPVFVNAFYSECPNLISDFDHTSLLRKVSKNLHNDSISTRDHNRLEFDDTFHTSLLHSALRMTRYGLYDEATSILAKMTSTERFKMSTYEWQNQYYSMVEFILKTAIKCECESREVNLRDCLPQELFDLVENETQVNKESIELSTIFNIFNNWKKQTLATLASDAEVTPEFKSLLRLNPNQIEDYIQIYVNPILGLTKIIQYILNLNDQDNTQQHIGMLLVSWQSISREKSNWTAELLKLFEICAIEILKALNQISPENARLLMSCINKEKNISPESIISFVQILSKNEDCKMECAQLATIAIRHIESIVNIKRQSVLFAKLARAYVSASLEDACEYLTLGLKVSDKLSSMDENFLNQILQFVAKYNDKNPNPELALQLAKVIETNRQGPYYWNPSLTSIALARTSGIANITLLTQWSDRDIFNLNNTLPDTLVYHLKNHQLSMPIVISLLRSIEPKAISDNHWEEIIKILSKGNYQDMFVLELIDLIEGEIPSLISLYDDREFVKKFDPISANTEFTKKRIELYKLKFTKLSEIKLKKIASKFKAVQGYSESKNQQQEDKFVKMALKELSPLNQKTLDNFVKRRVRSRNWNTFRFKILRDLGEDFFSNQREYFDAVLTSNELSLVQKLDILGDKLANKEKPFISGKSYLPSYADQIIESHINEISCLIL